MNEHQAAAWVFVLVHAGTIDRYTDRFSSDSRVPSREDFRSELSLDIVEHFDQYDPDRGAPSTWIWWRARATRQRYQRAWSRYEGIRADVSEDFVSDCVPADCADPDADMDWSSSLMAILERATQAEAEAVMSVLCDYSEQEVRDRLGITPTGRNYRLLRLAWRRRRPVRTVAA